MKMPERNVVEMEENQQGLSPPNSGVRDPLGRECNAKHRRLAERCSVAGSIAFARCQTYLRNKRLPAPVRRARDSVRLLDR